MLKEFRSLYRRIGRAAPVALPRRVRYAVYRNMVRCDARPPDKLSLRLAETRDELEACYKLLHDAYVQAGFTKPDPSGLRAPIYHALPTTTTLLAEYDERIVGTVSLIRDSALGFPMQKIFDIKTIRAAGGNIAEVSALAVNQRFQATGGMILFPLMKFMYEYSTRYFDTRHLVIAVNPRHIQFYESLLFFHRLKQNPVEHYDFVNGAPAVGAHLDLKKAPEIFKQHYDSKEPAKNLYRYFTDLTIPNIKFPDKRFYTTNDPVMTPELLDYFFNQRTQLFANSSIEEKRLLHAIYNLPDYRAVLPELPPQEDAPADSRRHRRFSVICPARLQVASGDHRHTYPMDVVECWATGFRARSAASLPINVRCEAQIDLGHADHSRLQVRAVRRAHSDSHTFVFQVEEHDLAWRKFVSALHKAPTHGDLDNATRFLE